MTKSLLSFLVLLSSFMISNAQDSTKTYKSIRIATPPRIDGVLDEPEWMAANVMSDFFQYLPNEGTSPDHPIEVRIIYDDQAIYVAAMMYDSAPDSILKEMSPRDGNEVNADYFRICLDPYYKHQDAYFFGVFASGVQFDYKETDYTFNAVWESAVKINDKGWVVEMSIPYSAIRFPKISDQKWSMQINRSVRRTREFTQWSKTPSSTSNPKIYWGAIKGISNIKLPVRLSFTPYLSSYLENAPEYQQDGSVKYNNSFSYNAGADVKYGIDERFTLDLTLFPDFGQVQSDNKVKNLSYREVTYDENRPFFKEGVELFDKNDLFYSRRIGQIPSGYFSAESKLEPGEKLTDNPAQAKLLNAMKISGRTDNGLGIGFFNAITNNTYAIASDSSRNERRILTEPLTNYNAIVLEQDLKNNSEVYLMNTSVIRDKRYRDANVTGGGFTLSNKKNTFAIEGVGAWSQRFFYDESKSDQKDTDAGYMYGAGIKKLGGNFGGGFAVGVFDDRYFTSDLGFQTINNKIETETFLRYNIYQPKGIFREAYNSMKFTYATHFVTGKTVSNQINYSFFTTLLNYLSVYGGGGFTPGNYYDYFEPRVEGRYQKGIRYLYHYLGISTDYRKKIALDLSLNSSNFIRHYVSEGYNTDVRLRYRINDRLTLKLNSNYNFDPYNLGFVDVENDEVIYGLRRMNTFTNQLIASYIFTKDMYVSVNVRHYWQTAEYRKYLTLLDDGALEDTYNYSQNQNFNFNVFNVDLVYSWQFAPGSQLSLVYKNAIENDAIGIVQRPSFDQNFKRVMNDPQTNSISLRLLYYFDYQYLKRSQ